MTPEEVAGTYQIDIIDANSNVLQTFYWGAIPSSSNIGLANQFPIAIVPQNCSIRATQTGTGGQGGFWNFIGYTSIGQTI